MQYCQFYVWLYAHFLKQKRGTELLVIRLLAHHKPSHTMRAVCTLYGTNSSMCVNYSSSIYAEVVIQRRLSWYVYVNTCGIIPTQYKCMQNLNIKWWCKKLFEGGFKSLHTGFASSADEVLSRRCVAVSFCRCIKGFHGVIITAHKVQNAVFIT